MPLTSFRRAPALLRALPGVSPPSRSAALAFTPRKPPRPIRDKAGEDRRRPRAAAPTIILLRGWWPRSCREKVEGELHRGEQSRARPPPSATTLVAKAAPDGYTLLVSSSGGLTTNRCS